MSGYSADYLDDFEAGVPGQPMFFRADIGTSAGPMQRVTRVATQFARELGARNIVKGDAVLLWSPNSASGSPLFWLRFVGVIAVPVDDASSPDFARRISSQVRTRLVLCPRERSPLFGGIATLDPSDLPAAIAHHSS